MTDFKTISKQFFKQKFYYVPKLWLTQLVVIVLVPIINLVFTNDFMASFGNRYKLLDVALSTSTISSVLFDFVFLAMACYRNEKSHLSQTYSLIPISNKKIFIANILSTIYCCIIFFSVQLIFNAFLLAIDSGNFIEQSVSLFKSIFSWNQLGNETMVGIDLILIVLLIQTFVSFINFSSKTITDFLPIKNAKFIRIILMTVFTIVGVYIALLIVSHIEGFIFNIKQGAALKNGADLQKLSLAESIAFYYPAAIMTLGTIIFGWFDIWLFDNYFEANV